MSEGNEVSRSLEGPKGDFPLLPPWQSEAAASSERVDTCLWCGKTESEHGEPTLVVVGEGFGRLCPVPDVTSQYWTSREGMWADMLLRRLAQATDAVERLSGQWEEYKRRHRKLVPSDKKAEVSKAFAKLLEQVRLLTDEE